MYKRDATIYGAANRFRNVVARPIKRNGSQLGGSSPKMAPDDDLSEVVVTAQKLPVPEDIPEITVSATRIPYWYWIAGGALLGYLLWSRK